MKRSGIDELEHMAQHFSSLHTNFGGSQCEALCMITALEFCSAGNLLSYAAGSSRGERLSLVLMTVQQTPSYQAPFRGA